MDIKAKLVKAFDTGKIKATFDVTLDDKFVIHGVKLIRGDKGDFVSMPSDSWKNKKGEIHHSDMAHPLDVETRSALHRAVTDAYFDHSNSMPEESNPGNLPFGM